MAARMLVVLAFAAVLSLVVADGPPAAVSGQPSLPGVANGFDINQATKSGAFNDLNALFTLNSNSPVNIHQNTLSEAGSLLNLQDLDRTKPVNINQDTTAGAFGNINAVFNPVPPGVQGAPVSITQDNKAVATGLINSRFAIPQPGDAQLPVNINQNINAAAAGKINVTMGANSGPVSVSQTSTAVAQGGIINSQAPSTAAGTPSTSGRKLLFSD